MSTAGDKWTSERAVLSWFPSEEVRNLIRCVCQIYLVDSLRSSCRSLLLGSTLVGWIRSLPGSYPHNAACESEQEAYNRGAFCFGGPVLMSFALIWLRPNSVPLSQCFWRTGVNSMRFNGRSMPGLWFIRSPAEISGGHGCTAAFSVTRHILIWTEMIVLLPFVIFPSVCWSV